MDEEKVDVQEEVVEQEEDTTTEEETEETEETTEETTEEVKEETVTISKSKLKAMQHKAIAYDALKKSKPSNEKEIIKDNSSLDPDELKLIAKGISDEVIEKAKIVSKGSGISLLEAINDPLVVAYDKQLKEVERKEKASLGASKGSNTYRPEKKFRPGMTEEEHLKAWKEKMSK